MSGHLESQSPPSSATQSISDKVSDKDNSRTHILDNPDAEATIKRAVRKMDLTIMPLMTLFYLLSFLDRANIGIYPLQFLTSIAEFRLQVMRRSLVSTHLSASQTTNILLPLQLPICEFTPLHAIGTGDEPNPALILSRKSLQTWFSARLALPSPCP
jgi:hypothetical protein